MKLQKDLKLKCVLMALNSDSPDLKISLSTTIIIGVYFLGTIILVREYKQFLSNKGRIYVATHIATIFVECGIFIFLIVS